MSEVINGLVKNSVAALQFIERQNQEKSFLSYALALPFISTLAQEWENSYVQSLTKVQEGVDQAVTNRENLYFGREFPAENRVTGGLHSERNFVLHSVRTPDYANTLGEILPELIKKTGGASGMGIDNYTGTDEQNQQVIEYMLKMENLSRSKQWATIRMELNNEWCLNINIEDLRSRSELPKLQLVLIPKKTEAFKIIEKKQERAVQFQETLEALKVERVSKEVTRAQQKDYQTNTIRIAAIHNFNGLIGADIVQALNNGGDWVQETDEEKLKDLAKVYGFTPGDNILGIFQQSDLEDNEDKPLLVIAKVDPKSDEARVYLSKNEVKKAKQEMVDRVRPLLAEEVANRIKAAETNKYTDISPRAVIEAALIEAKVIDHYYRDTAMAEQAKKDLLNTYSAILEKEAPADIMAIVYRWIGVVVTKNNAVFIPTVETTPTHIWSARMAQTGDTYHIDLRHGTYKLNPTDLKLELAKMSQP